MLGKLRFHRFLDDRLRQTAREAYSFAVNIGSGLFPQSQHLFITAKLNADLLKNLIRMLFNLDQGFFIKNVEVRDLTSDIGGQIPG